MEKFKIENLTEEEKRNLVGVFKILLDVDRRINPNLYKKSKSSEINRKPILKNS